MIQSEGIQYSQRKITFTCLAAKRNGIVKVEVTKEMKCGHNITTTTVKQERRLGTDLTVRSPKMRGRNSL